MYTYQEQCTMDLSDNYTLLYSFLCREVLDEFGLEGERALREGTRRYGRDRGLASRKKHQALGVKVNMQSLFGLGRPAPGPPLSPGAPGAGAGGPGVPHPGLPHGGCLEALR